MFDETSILTKLKNKRINEVKIINLKEFEIKKFDFLSSSEKDILARKIMEYSLKRDPSAIHYSNDLTKCFVKKRCEMILQKMREKKVKQQKLLNMFDKEIQELSFLTVEEKEELPKVIKEFCNNKEFEDLNKLIEVETQKNT